MRFHSFKRVGMAVMALSAMLVSNADIPINYYAPLQGKKGAELKTAVHELVAKAPYIKMLKYGSGDKSSWWGFYATDRVEADNAVIDRYSNQTFYYGERGSSVEGMDIEHSFPKSYWGGTVTNAYKDLFNLMPCENSINRSKSNNPMGRVDPDKQTDASIANGLTKVGKGLDDPSHNYWEPGDKWKGDFARGYMYMATAYQDYEWVLDAAKLILETGAYPTLKPEASALYIQWAKADPVAEIETVRVDSVMRIQGNRNPYVDFPNLMEYVWGDSIDVEFNVLTTVKSSAFYGSLDEPYVPDMPSYNPTEGDDSPVVPDGVGTAESPLNVTQVINKAPSEATPADEDKGLWVEGYIVGWIKTGYQYVNSEVACFEELDETPCDNASSLILGPQAYTNDYKNCIMVQLPSTPKTSKEVRDALNLADHPENHHQRVKICGDVAKYFSMPGLKSPTAYEFVEIPTDPEEPTTPDPEDPEDPETPAELGSKDNPYTVADVKAATDDVSDVWVVGYIIGTASSKDKLSATYSASNLALAATPDATEFIPVELPNNTAIRTALNLQGHADFVGKEIMIKGKITNYFSTRGLKNSSEYEFVKPSFEVIDQKVRCNEDYTVDVTCTISHANSHNVKNYRVWVVNVTGKEGYKAPAKEAADQDVVGEVTIPATELTPDAHEVSIQALNVATGSTYRLAIHAQATLVDGTKVQASNTNPDGADGNTGLDWLDIDTTNNDGQDVTGVEAIDAAADVPAEYFSIDGRRVDPATHRGLAIRRQGAAVDKIVIR